MAVICPTVTASEPHAYREQVERVAAFASRLHIDLMDGRFAPTHSPSLQQIWWPDGLLADIHLMYQQPMEHLDALLKLRPNLVIIHNEAEVHHMQFAALLQRAGIKAGLALLQDTPADYAFQIMHAFDHVMVFSGRLGYHGGTADLGLLDKVRQIRQHHPDAEIGWDGGINASNVRQLADAGVEVLNVGGYVQRAADPKTAYATLETAVSDI